ncbi:MAG: methionyl-tRNA formyltransferase [Candidatus Paceibacterota bacterium]
MKNKPRLESRPERRIRFVFFGTRPLAESVLQELENAGLVPAKIVSTEPTKELIDELSASKWDVFVVASYGAILPKKLLELPKRGVVNVHPSLLPRLRGPSPIRSAILNDEKNTGVSIMLLDEKMDEGPIIAQKKVAVPEWPPHGSDLDGLLAREGGRLLADYLMLWVDKKIKASPQNHDLATYSAIFRKEDGLLDLSADAYRNLLKIRAFEGWPGTYTFFERAGKRIRVALTAAHIENSKLVIERVKPEGKKEMPYEDFLRSGATPL